MISDLETRNMIIDGVDTPLLWPTSDTSCYQIIAADWSVMNPTIIENVRSREVVIQAGGNCGMYPLLHSNQFDVVFTFEPDPTNFRCLVHNCPSNRIVKFNTAVGNKPEPLRMGAVTDQNVGMHKIGAGDMVVYSMPIDSLGLDVVSLIHLDVEGYELSALRGAEQTIRKCRPTIAVELSQEVEETKAFLRYLNYKEVYFREAHSANYIFIPMERPCY